MRLIRRGAALRLFQAILMDRLYGIIPIRDSRWGFVNWMN